MRPVINIIIVLMLPAIVACNNPFVKKAENNRKTEKKLLPDKAIIKPPNKPEQIELIPCKYIVTEILTTSPRYQQLTKGLNETIIRNGGLSFELNLDASPNPEQDSVCCYSKNYDFSVNESYTDRQLNTARFSFNPNNKQLYEHDAVSDKLLPIKFDKDLLIKYKSFCK